MRPNLDDQAWSEEFEKLSCGHASRPVDCRQEQRTHYTIPRQIYKVLFGFVCDSPEHQFRGIIRECEESKNSSEAYRLLQVHCDPATYNTPGIMMDEIQEAASKRPKDIDELIANIRLTISNVLRYEARCDPLPKAKATWLPSLVVKTMDQETLEHVTQVGAQQDLELMLKAVKEFRLIKRIMSRAKTLRPMAERSEAEDDKEFETAEKPHAEFEAGETARDLGCTPRDNERRHSGCSLRQELQSEAPASWKRCRTRRTRRAAVGIASRPKRRPGQQWRRKR